ncbi:MAG: SMR family transporter [Actinomycetaceae bacterium]|nr:SMR family transporter [Actinomycetaceae bacterium]
MILIVSALFEAVWVNALDRIADGAHNLLNWGAFLAGTVVSVGGLAWALRTLPVGTAYAVWVGIGASAAVIWAMMAGTEPVSVVRILLIIGIVACVIGLKITT